jgi:uncharacterized membrane protein YGL010W
MHARRLPGGRLTARRTRPARRSAVVFNAGFVVVMLYTVFYLLLDFVAGLTWASLVGLPLWLGATAFQQSVSGDRCC